MLFRSLCMAGHGNEKLPDLFFLKVHQNSAGQKQQSVPDKDVFKPCGLQKGRGNAFMSLAVLIKILSEGNHVLCERQILGDEGLVIILLALQADSNEIVLGPKILSRGFIFEQQLSHILEDAQSIVMNIYSDLRTDTGKLQDRIHSSLRRFLQRDRKSVV